jgi:hypothetical protein
MRLNINRTVEKNFLIERDKTFDRKAQIFLGYLTSILLTGTLISIAALDWWTDRSIGYFNGVLIFFACISLYGLIVRDRLFKINATRDIELNKKIAREYVTDFFKKNNFIDTGAIWTSCRQYKFMGDRTNNRVTIIFHQDKILFNAEFFGRGGLQSPLHPIIYLFKFVRLKSRIERELGQ